MAGPPSRAGGTLISETETPPSAPPAAENGKLGTFGGVFVPSVLTILGVVMFLMFGRVTGLAGLDHTIMIIMVANTVSILTSLSLAVIATNAKVGGGGDYFLISRSLGLEFGGAIGTVLYLAQSISVGFYVVGFTDALSQVLGLAPLFAELGRGTDLVPAIVAAGLPDWAVDLPTWIWELPLKPACSSLMGLLLFGVAFKGADVGTKVQYFILVALVFALGSYFWGSWTQLEAVGLSQLAENRSPANMTTRTGVGLETPYSFWIVFAMFFPAVTGFTQGVSMSGDLKDPQKSLPIGTFAAVAVSMLVYLVLPVFLAGTSTQEQLLSDPGADTMKRWAVFPWMVDVGVFAATISSALASLMGAPRILTAMASDRIFPGSGWFAKAHAGSAADPRKAMVLTLGIGLAAIWAGDLDTIAQVVTMFFLLSYGALNWATYVEGAANNPNFRPRFRISGWRTSLAGAVVCAAVMFAIDAAATIAAGAILVAIFQGLRRRDLDHPAGDARRGFYVQRVKEYLLRLAQHPMHSRAWRPVVLAVTENDASEDEPVARFAKAISSSQGVLTLVTVLPGKFEDLVDERHERREAWHERAKDDMLPYFREVVIGSDTGAALRALQLSYGMGQLRPNTLLLGWSDTINAEYERILTDSARLRRNVILLHAAVRSAFHTDAFDDIPSKRRRIDVWWRGEQNGTLALLLAHLVRENDTWRGCTIRLLRIEQDEEKTGAARQELVDLIDASRIAAEVEIVTDPRPPFEVIAEASGESHLVFMGVGFVGEGGAVRADLARYKPVLEQLPTTALVFSSQNLDVEV